MFRALLLLSLLLTPHLSWAKDDDKAINAYLNLGSLPFGSWTFGLDLALGNFTLGPYGTKTRQDKNGVNQVSEGVGGRLNYYTSGAIQSSFRYSLIVQSLSTKVEFQGMGNISDDVPVTLLAGYHWVWKTFNLGVGAGLTKYRSSGSQIVTNTQTGQRRVVELPGETGIAPSVEIAVGAGF
jgi:hypothetical protein